MEECGTNNAQTLLKFTAAILQSLHRLGILASLQIAGDAAKITSELLGQQHSVASFRKDTAALAFVFAIALVIFDGKIHFLILRAQKSLFSNPTANVLCQNNDKWTWLM